MHDATTTTDTPCALCGAPMPCADCARPLTMPPVHPVALVAELGAAELYDDDEGAVYLAGLRA